MTTYDPGRPLVELGDDHPGVSRSRIPSAAANEIAAAARGLRPDDPPRHIDYTAAENATWSTVQTALGELHRAHACQAYLDGVDALPCPTDRVPQLADVSRRLRDLTGWRVEAAPGLAPIREFYGALGDRRFMSTQYVRHPSVPLYTPEPDVIHEVIGHCNSLADTRFAELYAVAGAASRRADDEALARFSKDVLVHARIRRRVGGRRPQGLRRRAAVELRGDERLPRRRDPRPGTPTRWPSPSTTSTCTSRCCSPRPTSTRSSTTSPPGSTPSDYRFGVTDAPAVETPRPRRCRGERSPSVRTVDRLSRLGRPPSCDRVLTQPLTAVWCTRDVKLLVAEDDRAVRQSLERALTLEGYDVATVKNGAEALSWLSGDTADAVLLDVSMPVVDGLTVVSRAARRSATACRS